MRIRFSYHLRPPPKNGGSRPGCALFKEFFAMSDPLSPSPLTFQPHRLADLKQQAPATTDWLCHGYLAAGNATLLTSQWKAGKTTLLALLLDRMSKGGEL